MNEPAAPFIAHTPPAEYPPHHYTGVAVPSDFARVITAAAAKDGVLFEDQLLKWAQAGAECSRLHQSNGKPQRRKTK